MDEAKRKLISLVVPVFNEEENLEPLYAAVTQAIAPLQERYDFELLFTDNHSSDRSFEILAGLAGRDPRVRALRFSRNFGFQKSVLTGFLNARGDAAIQLDCDLQDPPELIPEFLARWEQGYQVVFGIRKNRQEGWLNTAVRKIFYRLIDALSEDHLPHDAGDFRLVDRCVLEGLRRIDDQQPYVRGTIAAMGFNQVGVEYTRGARQRGQSKFSFMALLGLALDGILNHSIVPLRLSTYVGLMISVLTFLGVLVYGVGRFVFGQKWPPGFATTTVLILFSLSLNALFLGIIGEYLGRIYQQVKKRPLTIVEREIGGAAQAPAREAGK